MMQKLPIVKEFSFIFRKLPAPWNESIVTAPEDSRNTNIRKLNTIS